MNNPADRLITTLSGTRRLYRAKLVELLADGRDEVRWSLEPTAHPSYEQLSPAARHVSGLIAPMLIVCAVCLTAPLVALSALSAVLAAALALAAVGSVWPPFAPITSALLDVLRLRVSAMTVLMLLAASCSWCAVRRRFWRRQLAQEALLKRRVEPRLTRVCTWRR